jgi:hypothetical protein
MWAWGVAAALMLVAALVGYVVCDRTDDALWAVALFYVGLVATAICVGAWVVELA